MRLLVQALRERKTHTIGNLVGHCWQGKSSWLQHTTKALRMVRHHIVPELRPLCVRCWRAISTAESSWKRGWLNRGTIVGADAGSLEMEAKS